MHVCTYVGKYEKFASFDDFLSDMKHRRWYMCISIKCVRTYVCMNACMCVCMCISMKIWQVLTIFSST